MAGFPFSLAVRNILAVVIISILSMLLMASVSFVTLSSGMQDVQAAPKLAGKSSKSSKPRRSSSRSSSSSNSGWGRSSWSKPKPKPKPKPKRQRPKTDKKPVANKQTARPTSSGYQKPGKPAASRTTAAKSAGYQKPATQQNKPKQSQKPPKSVYTDRLKAENAKLAKQRTAQVKQSRQSAVFKRTVPNDKKFKPKEIATVRTTYYSTPSRQRHHTHFERRYHYGDRDYGGFDPSFLMVMAMADEPGDAALWYAMTGSPWFAMWMSQSKQEAAEHG